MTLGIAIIVCGRIGGAVSPGKVISQAGAGHEDPTTVLEFFSGATAVLSGLGGRRRVPAPHGFHRLPVMKCPGGIKR